MSKLNIPEIRAPMKAVHDLGVNLTLEWRLRNLEQLRRLAVRYEPQILQALTKDLGRHAVESSIADTKLVLHELDLIVSNLKKWMQPQSVSSPLLAMPCFSSIQRRPLRGPGCLIIGPFNYPYSLVLLPAIGSIAGGNPTVIKPSELCPATTQVLVDMAQHMDPGVLQVVVGGVAETTALLEETWGKIMFTGSERVGKIVAMAAAQTLTPVLLELGGKSPMIVDETAPTDLRGVANRIIWGKTFNCGQTCIAPDYVLVHESKVDELVNHLRDTLEAQFGLDGKTTGLGKMVSTEHAQRIIDMIEQVEDEATRETTTVKIVTGGSKHADAKSRFVPPTIVLNPSRSSRILQEEIFGPVLPIVTVASRAEAMEFVRSMPGTPLALTVFTRSAEVFQDYIDHCPSGSAVRNDSLIQNINLALPFGGLGTSGYGNYHGRYSFDAFTHALATVYRPCAPGMDWNMLRYHPFGTTKGNLLVKYGGELPVVPVLHLRTVFVVFAIMVALLVWTPVRAIRTDGLDGVANALERVVEYLRTKA